MLSRGTRKWGASVHAGAIALAVILIVAVVIALAGCSDDHQAAPRHSTSPAPGARVAAGVPPAIAATGKVIVATDPSYPPNEFRDADGKTLHGFDIDLFAAIAGRLGLTVQWQPVDFSQIVPGVVAGRYQLGVSSLPINAARQSQVTMVSYLTGGTQWAQRAGGTVDLSRLCGVSVAVQTSTIQADDLAVQSHNCVAAAQPAITIHGYAKQDDVTAAVLDGTADAMVADAPVVGYAVKRSAGQLTLLGPVDGAVLYGFVLPKGQPEFARAITKALAALMADGSYQAIADRWGVTAGALTTPPMVDPSPPAKPRPSAIAPSPALSNSVTPGD